MIVNLHPNNHKHLLLPPLQTLPKFEVLRGLILPPTPCPKALISGSGSTVMAQDSPYDYVSLADNSKYEYVLLTLLLYAEQIF